MTRKIGILCDPHGGYQREVIKGLALYAASVDGWELRHLVVRPGNLRRMMAWKPDAIIANCEPETLLPAVRATRCVGVSLYTPVEERSRLYAVTPDYRDVANSALRFAMGKGYKAVTVLHVKNRAWTDAVLAQLTRAGGRQGFLSVTAVAFGRQERSWVTPMRAVLERTAYPAMILAEPELARACSDACRTQKIAVPEQVAICALDDNTLICGLSRPALTGLRLPGLRAARVIGDLLTRRFAGETVTQHNWAVGVQEIVERRSTEISAVDDALVAAALAWMRERAERRGQVSQLLVELGVSRRLLERRFSAAIGRSPHAELTRLRKDAASRRLRDSDLPVARIAEQCGYLDICQFSRDFKRATGQSPSRWRSQRR